MFPDRTLTVTSVTGNSDRPQIVESIATQA